MIGLILQWLVHTEEVAKPGRDVPPHVILRLHKVEQVLTEDLD